ncbi:M1 family aminopeptidase [Thioalkalivibrio sp.]|uniref:M1 family metallopeptidase n=1 Tax=Thioalkalivibrio sp. TaxID=2093813 RepID=UPI0012D6D321|nr:M1 family aminopeptidase [Thioalkalivibrio sp.]TVP79548.1 MAG: M1 family peptidase [Thioalkalivibrio sp.]
MTVSGIRSFLFAVAFAAASLLPASAIADVPQWRMSLDLDPAAGGITGELELDLPAGIHEFRLLDALELQAARAGDTELTTSRAGAGRYRVELPADSWVTVSWGGTLPDGDPMRSRLFLTAAGGFLPEGTDWYPRFEQESFALRLEARVPEGQRFVATGSLRGEPVSSDGHYSAVHEHPRTDAVVVVTGPWVERSLETNGVQVRTLFRDDLDAAHAQNYLEHSAEYLRMFSERAGPYPYDSFTIAATPMPVGYAFPGFTVLGERVIPLPFIPRTSLAHELMHNWWGTGVRIDYATGNWSEALTTYMADYHLDELRGEGRSTRHRWLLDLAWLPVEEDRPLEAFRGGNQGANRIVGYNRGALLFHMLRERIGDEAFDAGTRKIADRHMFDVAGWEDLIRAFSDAAGRDLDSFFTPWLERSDLPELALHSVQQEKNGSGWVLRGELEQAQEAAPWPLRVPVVVETDAGQQRHVVELDTRQARFDLALEAPAQAITADPDFDVLRRLPDPPPILRTASLNPNTRLIATQEGLAPFARAILEHPPEMADEFDPQQPLLVMGSTDDVIRWLDAAGAPKAPEDLARRGHARMWTLPGTRTAVVSSSDAEGLRNLVGALRHHGHRSYLVQDADGRTTEYGVWEAETNPLRIEVD